MDCVLREIIDACTPLAYSLTQEEVTRLEKSAKLNTTNAAVKVCA